MEAAVVTRAEKLTRRCQRHVRRIRDTLSALAALVGLWMEQAPPEAYSPWLARHQAFEDLLRALEAYSALEPAPAADDLKRLQARSWRALQDALRARVGGPEGATRIIATLNAQRAVQERRLKARRRFFTLRSRLAIGLNRLELAAAPKHARRIAQMRQRLAALEREADARPARASQGALKLEKKVKTALSKVRR